jgi:hypothetical protein
MMRLSCTYVRSVNPLDLILISVCNAKHNIFDADTNIVPIVGISTWSGIGHVEYHPAVIIGCRVD